MGFGVGCYANCCDHPIYQVFAIMRAATASVNRLFSAADPAAQWEQAGNEAWTIFQNGGIPKCPAPCRWVCDPNNPIPQTPEGWIKHQAYFKPDIITGSTGMGARNVFDYPEGAPPFISVEGNALPGFDFALRRFIAHSSMGYMGTYTTNPGLRSATATAYMCNRFWLFLADVSSEGETLSSLGYSRLDFQLMLNQFNPDYLPPFELNLPARIIEFADRNAFEPWQDFVLRDVDLGGFRMVSGNCAGKMSIDQLSGEPIADYQSAVYWALHHITNGDYVDVGLAFPSPPRDGSISEMSIDVPVQGTQITDVCERLFGLPNGVAWFLAIIPEKVCLTSSPMPGLPQDVLTSIKQFITAQAWKDNKMSSLNVTRLVATGPDKSKILVPAATSTSLDL